MFFLFPHIFYCHKMLLSFEGYLNSRNEPKNSTDDKGAFYVLV